MAERPGPITSFVPLPTGGLPGDSVADRLRRLAQVEPESFRAGQADFSTRSFVDPRPEREQLQARLLQFNLAIPGEDIGTVMGKALSLEVHLLKTEQARAGAAAQRIRATQEDIRGAEIARLMAKVRSGVTKPLIDPDQALADKATEVVDDQQTLQKRLESMDRFTKAELSAGLPGAPVGLADPFRRKLEEELLTQAEEQAVNPDRIPLDQVKDLLLGFRLLDEQSRAGGEVINSRKIVKLFGSVLDKADEGGLRLRLKIELQGMVAKRDAIPGPILDAISMSVLGSRRAGLFGRGFAEGITLTLSENIRVGFFGERGLAEEIAGGNEGDWVPRALGFMAGAIANFVALDQALVRGGVRTFSGRSFPERMMIETAMQDVVRIPGIVFNGRIQGFSDETIIKQIGVELGMGVLAGVTLGLAGGAALFSVREFRRNSAQIGRGLGRIASKATEKVPQIFDLLDTVDLIGTTMVQGVTGTLPRVKMRSARELRVMVESAADQLGLGAAQLGKVVRQVAPRRGKSGKLDKLSSREMTSLFTRLVTPDAPGVPRGTAIKVLPGGETTELEHVFFAVPTNQAEALRRGGIVPVGTQIHARPNAAARELRGRSAEVFALQRTTLHELDSGVTTIGLDLDTNTLSKTMRPGGKPDASGELGGFVNKGEPFGLDPIDLLLAEPVPLSVRIMEGARKGGPKEFVGRIIPAAAIKAKIYSQSFWGLRNSMLEAMAPVAGRRFAQMMAQFEDLRALSGEFKTRYREITDRLTDKEITNVELMMGGRKDPPTPDDASRVATAYHETRQLDDEIMTLMEKANPDGSILRKLDGTPFQRRSTHMPQPLADDVIEAIETASGLDMRLRLKTGMFEPFDEATGKFVKPSVVGGLRKAQKKRFATYNAFINDLARQMDKKGMRYDKATQTFLEGQTSRVSQTELKKQARNFLIDHRDAISASQFLRPGTPTYRDLLSGDTLAPRRMAAIDFSRRFEYDPAFIRPNLGINRIRHIDQLFGRRAEGLVFGENLKRLREVGLAIEKETRGRLGQNMANRAGDTITKLYSRDTGNQAIQGAIGSLEKANIRAADFVKDVTAAAGLGPGSTFQFGGNGIWAVFGAAMQLPVNMKFATSFGFNSFAAGGIGAFAGSKLGQSLGDTPEERQANARLLMILGASGGFGATLFRDTTAKALIPAALPTAAALAGFLGPDSEWSPFHRGLLVAGGFLTGTAAASLKPLKRLAASPTAVRAARRAGAIDIDRMMEAQPDLITNQYHPAFRPVEGSKIRDAYRSVMFGVTQGWEIWARASSAKATVAAVGDMIQRLAKEPGLPGSKEGKFFVRQLQRLGIDKSTLDKVIRENDAILPDALLDRVMRRGVENTQYVLRAMDLPLMWSSPWGRVFTQFMGMGLRAYDNTVRFALQEAGFGNWTPIAKLIPFAIVAGLSVEELRTLVNGKDLEPRAIGKLTRAVQILGPSGGLFGDMARVASRMVEGVAAGTAVQEGVEPASVGISRNIVNALAETVKSLITGDPDIRSGRTTLNRTMRTISAGRAITAALERHFPTDEDFLRQFSAQMPHALQEIEAAKQGKSLIDFLQGLPEPAFPEARRLAERAAPAIEGTLRGVSSGLGFLPGIAPSLEAEEAKAESILSRLDEAPGVLKRRAAVESRIKGKPITPGGVRERLIKQAESDSRKGIIGGIAIGIRNKDRPGVIDKIEKFMRMRGKAFTVINALRQRALTAGDESLATSVPESLIHRLELEFNPETSLREVSLEISRGRPSAARMKELIEYRRSFTAAP